MFKKILSSVALFFVALMALADGSAKYVFYFIGDGMGVNQVNATQTYLAALEGRIGTAPLCFTQFPYATLVTTYSATNGVTDSAAAGTALATGHKSKNGALGVLADLKTPVKSIAQAAHEAGFAVGVATSVSVDHATPAAFYAHQSGRGSYYAIGQDLIKAGFDFYAGSDFLEPTPKKDSKAESLYRQSMEAGYTLARGYGEVQRKAGNADKLILLQTEKASQKDKHSLPYAIDRQEGSMTLDQIAETGINHLMRLNETDKKDGFFLMLEGGKIDWACHANDAATVVREVIDMDEAVKRAFAFYQQHPDETLIVVTADHETGGIVLGRGPYKLHLDLLQAQQVSTEAYSEHVKQLHKEMGKELTWQVMQNDLKAYYGFWDKVKVTDKQEARLKEKFDRMMNGKSDDKKTLYASTGALADEAREVMAEAALVGWQSTGHSNGFVPVYAIGAGADAFHGQIDNTEIPKKIAAAMGIELDK